MQIGLNFALGGTLPIAQRLIRAGHVDYCELLIDNFLHVPPAELRKAFDCPVGFHIMLSRFLEQDRDALADLAARLRPYIEQLEPLYISDHVACFSHQGRQLYHLAEYDYRPSNRGRTYEAVSWWQDQLGQRLWLENFPSIMDGGLEAPAFFDDLIRRTGAGLLFDASNAVCAQRNCGLPAERWLPLLTGPVHLHVAGYGESILAPKLTLDTHDSQLAADTLAFLSQHQPGASATEATLTYERDDHFDEAGMVEDLQRLRRLYGAL